MSEPTSTQALVGERGHDAPPKRRPLRVAMVVASPFPANHGTPGSIREMAVALSKKGHHIHIAAYHYGNGPVAADIRIHRIPNFGFKKKVVVGPTWEKPLLDFLMLFNLYQVVSREKIDIIHAHNYEGAIIGYIVSLITGKPLIYNAVNTMEDELATYNFIRPRFVALWLAKFLDYVVPHMGDHIFAISQELVDFMNARKIPSERVHFIPLGIDLSCFEGHSPAFARLKYGLGDQPLIMYTGILDKLQRVDHILLAMQLVLKRFEHVRLVMVVNIAKEEDSVEFWTLADKLGIRDRITIVENKTFEEIPLILSAADVTIVSRPYLPGFPIKMLNYMAAGKPIVTYRGASKGLRHNEHAYLVENNNWQGLAEGIISLLQHPEKAAELGANARQWVASQYCWRHLSEKIEAVYYQMA